MTHEKKQMIDWLRAKGACPEGREWAERECNSLAEVWAKAKPEWLIWVACLALDKRTRVAMCAAFAERVRHLMTDQRSKDALDVAHRYGRGEATDSDLADASAAAGAAARAAARAARAAAGAAAGDAAWDAAWAATWDAAGDAAWDAACEWQAAHVRANFQPDWSL